MEGSCKLGAVTTALVEGADRASAPFGIGSSLSKRDTAYAQCFWGLAHSCRTMTLHTHAFEMLTLAGMPLVVHA